MKRELRHHYYPGGLSVVVVIESDSDKGEPHLWDVFEVAFLTVRESLWNTENASKMLPEEKAKIENNAEQWMHEWIKWSCNPNRDFPAEYATKRAEEFISSWQHKWKCE